MARLSNQFHIDFFADRAGPKAAGADQQAVDPGQPQREAVAHGLVARALAEHHRRRE